MLGTDKEAKDWAERFFNEVVEPSVTDFLAEPWSLRHGYLAAIALYHMADHWYHTYCPERHSNPDAKDFAGAIAAEHEEFGLLRDVCFVAKHAKLRGSGRQGVSSFTQLEVRHLGLYEARMGEGRYADQPPVVTIVREGRVLRSLEGPVRAARDMWLSRFRDRV